MLCPHCGSDLGDTAARCPSCGAELDAQELVIVYRTADVALLPILKSLLDSADIPYIVQGEEALGMLPLGRFAVGVVNPRTMAASILVPRERAGEAEQLLTAVSDADTDEAD